MSDNIPEAQPPENPSETVDGLKAALVEAQSKLSEIQAIATQAVAAKTQITDSQAVVATKSDHIQKAQEHADGVRANLDRLLTAATQNATEAEGLKNRGKAASDEATQLLAATKAAKTSVEAELASIAAIKKSAEQASEQTKSLAAKADTIEKRVVDYEKYVAELQKQCSEHLQTIETLLRGATSAGLAHSFDQRRQSFLKPHGRWQLLFVGSVVLIVGLTVSGLLHIYQSNAVPSYDELFRLWLARLPIAGALVWLALHASHEAALAKRLEEDYGYKSAIASCFEGFRKQMAEIGTDIPHDSQLAILCANTLTTISSPPGRIYDKHELTVTPSGELAEAAKAAAKVAQAAKGAPS